MNEPMNKIDEEMFRTAEKMVECDPDTYKLCHELREHLQKAADLHRRGGGAGIRSTQVLAALIVSWQAANPELFPFDVKSIG